ncbi:hypothetical protein HETIRDRAFT_408774 [Heterobasidion irregulare TC 32-1]|uniref:Uncharacterized protein n=1 Tax=Heterobasidion irregulare (strain TC 32-1) TaxID=747525 RepID=W4JU20_HETIT|nr:uncharacterized protein HETIRDRAFT_408774 [Heterobasidion irregulare TC 32-1]XP_009551812.1 uncharacterized protein HETIRDRAFT_412073 [Heterobasidion irregulare TC 32-1]ETW76954.1 hypothetical protein HETIRDRAFT_412073 [Heterobasidion irregulare TC 32-1]ETW82360.1 hypothetical protein HETIRDRAFT_408774 [Heterobasidion irregulare TC 32-1]
MGAEESFKEDGADADVMDVDEKRDSSGGGRGCGESMEQVPRALQLQTVRKNAISSAHFL